jgi:hypothetical protein
MLREGKDTKEDMIRQHFSGCFFETPKLRNLPRERKPPSRHHHPGRMKSFWAWSFVHTF